MDGSEPFAKLAMAVAAALAAELFAQAAPAQIPLFPNRLLEPSVPTRAVPVPDGSESVVEPA